MSSPIPGQSWMPPGVQEALQNQKTQSQRSDSTPGGGPGDHSWMPPSVRSVIDRNIGKAIKPFSTGEPGGFKATKEELELAYAAAAIANRTGLDPVFIMNNFEMVSTQLAGSSYRPQAWTDAVADSHLRGRLATEIGRLRYRQMGGDTSDATQKRIDELWAQMPPEREVERGWGVRALSFLASQAPMWIDAARQSALQGAAGAAGGAAAAAAGGLPLLAAPGVGAPAYVLSIAGATIAGFGVGKAAGASQAINEIEAGMVYDAILRMEDENGASIDPAIARRWALSVGPVAAALEQLQIGKLPGLNKLTGPALRKGIVKTILDGTAMRALSRVAAESAGNVLENTVQEVAQEGVAIIAEEVAKHVANDTQGTTFEADGREIAARLVETAKQSASGFGAVEGFRMIARAPGAYVNESADRAAPGRAAESAVLQSEVDEAAPGEASQAIARDDYRATVEEQIARAQQNAREGNAGAAKTMLQLIHVLEGLDAEGERGAIARQRAETLLRSDDAARFAEMRLSEYREQYALDGWRATPEAQRWEEQIVSRFPDYTPEEINASFVLVEIGAAQKGVEPGQYIAETFGERIIANEKQTAQFTSRNDDKSVLGGQKTLQDGREIIFLTENADQSTLIHEFGHILRKRLAPEFLQAANELYKVTDGKWTKDQEEQFALDWEEYWREGKTPSTRHQTVFQKIANMMRRVYAAIVDGSALTDDKRALFDLILERAESTEVNARRSEKTISTSPSSAQDRAFSQMEAIDPGFSERIRKGEEAPLPAQQELPETPLYQTGNKARRKKMLAHEASVKQMVSSKVFVPDDVLGEYNGHPWAMEEIAHRDSLRKEASEVLSVDQFLSSVLLPGDALRMEEYYRHVYNGTQKRTISEGNQKWAAGLDKADIETYLLTVALQDDIDALPAKALKDGARLLGAGETLPAPLFKKICAHIIREPELYRELFLEELGEQDQLYQLELERLSNPTEAELLAAQKENREYREKNAFLNKSYDKLTASLDKHESMLRQATARAQIAEANRKSAKEEAALIQKEQKSVYKDALKSARQEARLGASEAARSARKKMRELYQYRETLRRQIKRIMAKPSGSIDFEYAKKIKERQALLRNGGLSAKHRETLTSILEDVNYSHEVKKIIALDLQRENLKKMTPDQLDAVEAEINALRAQGRALRAQKIASDRLDTARIVHDSIKGITEGKGLDKLAHYGSKESNATIKKGRIPKGFLYTFRPERLFRFFGGGEENALYGLFWRRVNRATDAELRMADERITAGEAEMKRLGITPAKLRQVVSIGGSSEHYTRDEIIHMYIALQDAQSKAALIHGNKIPLGHVLQYINLLSAEEKQWGDWMINSFGDENFTRIQEVLIETENKGLEKVARYFPMLRQDFYHDFADEVADGILRASWASRKGVQKDFTIARQQIADNHQKPIRLGATSIWRDQTVKQERYIAAAKLVKKMRAVSLNENFKHAITQEFGVEAFKIINGFINDYANPNIYKARDGAARATQVLRKNYATAKLAFNFTTVIKQIPSAVLYLRHAGVPHMAASLAQFALSPGKIIQKVGEKDPQVKARSINREMDEYRAVDKSRYDQIVKKVGAVGFWSISWMDKIAVTIGWNAVYEKAKSQGLSESEAIEKAQTATLQTQPAGRAKDVAAIYRSEKGFSWFLMFSNQLNQIFNLSTADLYLDAKTMISQTMSMEERRAAAGRAFGTVAALAINAVAMGFISRGFTSFDEDDEDAGDKILTILTDIVMQELNSITLAGPSIVAGAKGQHYARGAEPVSLFYETGSAVTKLKEAIQKGEFDEDDMNQFFRLLESAGTLAGYPSVFARRVRRTFFDDEFMPQFEIGELFGVRGSE